MTRQIPVTQARAELSDLVSRVAFSGERVSLTRHGKSVAALVSAADLSRLEALDEAGADTRTADTGTTDDGVGDHPERVDLSPARLDPVTPAETPAHRRFGIAAEHRHPPMG
ncbi:type II toxin-antitoxin system Phd/YefM family antitoxin [Parafrankia discariae]|uniref:type II toxin-antitoxin system Phd/YefM family antitoxin n=1 Tax=Parafrankia discariae TaxID=365528 RepID=UPI0003646398|nr:type II toxin-antitoxin system Phd/YefM family antitoxin [Parafrankia discariae]